LKLLQERKERTLEHIGIGNNFLNRTPIAQQLRGRIDKQDYTKLKVFCIAKVIVVRLKKQPIEWEKNFDKGLITRIYRELKRTTLPNNQ
jgi:hypothetical protein